MKSLLLAVSILSPSLSPGITLAQSEKSNQDKPAASGQGQQTDKMSAGTTGAIQNSTGGVATSPQNV